jgi:GDP-L-fucose synthase
MPTSQATGASSSSIAPDARIFVAGHRGLVGSAIVRRLEQEGFRNLLVAGREQLDLRDQAAVNYWFQANRPDYVFLVAGTVGGILPNSLLPADFIYDNLMIHATVVHAAYRFEVRKLLYLGSSCIYPRESSQPIDEDSLLAGPLEPTNEAYAIAKIAGIKLCAAYKKQHGCNFISGMPTNLYGPNDNFDLDTAHVLPALIRRFYEAKLRGELRVTVWGSGAPRREFMHVEDLADCCLFLMRHYEGDSHVNVGTGQDCSIRELAQLIRARVHPDAEIAFDASKPDGMPRKLLDVGRLHALGWKHRIGLEEGVARTCAWFAEHYDEILAAESRASHPLRLAAPAAGAVRHRA